MKRSSMLLAAMLVLALSACGRKEEVAAAPAVPASVNIAPVVAGAAPEAVAEKPADDSNAANGLKPIDVSTNTAAAGPATAPDKQ